jgi:Flp pilus assembly protein TadG
MNLISSKKISRNRRGAVLVLMTILVVVLLGMAAFAVDLAYLQLARVELRAATDAAAKAAAASLRTSQNTTTATSRAQAVALLNQVNGKGHQIAASQLEFGQVAYQTNGTWKFQPGASPYYSVRVNGALTSGSSAGRVSSFFGRIFGVTGYDTTQMAVASHYEQQIVLCLDRSGSMMFDTSGVDGSYPSGYSATTKPHRTDSRWGALRTAVSTFVSIIDTSALKPEVALITWASTVTNDWQTGLSFPVTSRDVGFTTTYSTIKTSLRNRAQLPLVGYTNMGAGLQDAIAMLDTSTKVAAKKSIILMSDGLWNQGTDPVTFAYTAKSKGYDVHTISFIESGNATTMQQIATITGGKSYEATDSASLTQIFTELANTLPVVLTD